MKSRIAIASVLAFISGVGITYLALKLSSPERARQQPSSAVPSDARFGNSTTKLPAGMPSTKRAQRSEDLDAPGTQDSGPRSNLGRTSEQPSVRPARSMYSEGKDTGQTRQQRRASKQLDRLMELVANNVKENTESAPSSDTRTLEARTRWSQLEHEDRQFLIAECLQEYHQADKGEDYD